MCDSMDFAYLLGIPSRSSGLSKVTYFRICSRCGGQHKRFPIMGVGDAFHPVDDLGGSGKAGF